MLKSTRHHTSLFFIALSLYSRGKDFCILLCFCQKYTGICKGRSLPKRAGTLPVGVPALFFHIFRPAESGPSARLFFLSFLNVLFICLSFPPGGKYSACQSLPFFLFSFKFLFYLSQFSAARKVCVPVLLFMLLTLLVFLSLFYLVF